VTSAGSQPASELNPAVVQGMAEIGLDISAQFPKPLTTGKVQAADIVITMGCGDVCPVFPGKRYLAWELPDPAGLTVEQVRPIRDEISARAGAPGRGSGARALVTIFQRQPPSWRGISELDCGLDGQQPRWSEIRTWHVALEIT